MSYYCSKNIKNRIAQLTQAVRLNKTGKSAFSKYLASLRSDAIRWLHDLRPTLEFKYFPSLSIPLDIQYTYTIYTIYTLDILYCTIHTILPWTLVIYIHIGYTIYIYNIYNIYLGHTILYHLYNTTLDISHIYTHWNSNIFPAFPSHWIYNINIQYIQYLPWTYYTIQFIQYFLGHTILYNIYNIYLGYTIYIYNIYNIYLGHTILYNSYNTSLDISHIYTLLSWKYSTVQCTMNTIYPRTYCMYCTINI